MAYPNNNNKQQSLIRINYYIKAPEVRLIGADGANLGVVKTGEAIGKAKDLGLDLVEINGKVSPPVCKITSIGKLKYEEKKKASEAKKHATISDLKEIGLRPNTSLHDLATKAKHIKEFLEDGHRVKLNCKFAGREIAHLELGYDQLKKVLEMVGENVVVLTPAKAEAKTVSMIIGKGK